VQHSGSLLHAAVPGAGRHGGLGMSVAAMVGGCMVYLFLPTYIVCHVSVIQKILSMQRPFFSYVGFRRIWYGTKKPSRPAFYPNKPVPKILQLALSS
jgi:hypothetical protein